VQVLPFIGTAALWLVSFLVVVTVVITFHELGHFLMARLFGVKVDRFSIGFGRTIVARTDRSGVEWRIAWLPLGGYVRFAGDANVAGVPDQQDLAELKREIVEAEGPGAERRYYHFKPVWQRALIALAGPLANAVLAIAVFSLVYGVFGYDLTAAKVGGVEPGSPAARAGFQAGDVIVRADGRSVDSFESLIEYVSPRPGETIAFRVEREGRAVELKTSPSTNYEIRMGPGGGLKDGDIVTGVDGKSLNDLGSLPAYIDRRKGAPVTLQVNRPTQQGPKRFDLALTPQSRAAAVHALRLAPKRGMLGITSGQRAVISHVQPGPVESVQRGARRTLLIVNTTIHYLARIFTGKESGDQLSGPIGMLQATGSLTQEAAEVQGPLAFRATAVGMTLIQLIAIISIGIGFLNLLPIPILDGGHLLFYAYEAVARKPLGARVQELGYQVGLALLLGLMLFATWNDLQKQAVFEKLLGGLHS
jgi:regulator of sigma E protease